MPFPYTLPIVFRETATPLDIAGAIINDAATEVGLARTEDPFQSTDGNFIQLVAFLKSLGRDLWRRHRWPALTKLASFTTVAGDGTYALPADFGYLINQSFWNLSTDLPVGGGLSSEQWRAIKGRGVELTTSNYFRLQQQELVLLPDTSLPAGQTLAFEYVSRFWVQPTGQTEPTSTAPSAQSDVLWFDPLLLVRGLKAYFLRAKGLPTAQDAQSEFDETLYLVMGDDAAAPVINAAPRTGFRLISEWNLPDTGHGL